MRTDGVPFDPPQYAQISDVQMAAGHEVGDEMSPGNMLPINSEVKEVVFFVDSSEDLQGVDAGAFDAGENASVASVASAYKAAQLFTQEDLEMLAGFQVGDELLNEDAGGVPFDPPQYAQISDVQMAAGHEVGDEREPESFGWDVTVEANSGVADGSVQLTFADGADIRDLAGNAANLDGVTSTSVTLDNVLPVISAEVMSVGGDDIISKADLDANQPVVVKVTGEVGPDGVFVELVSGSNHLAEGTFAVTAGYDPAIGEEFTLEVSGDVLQNASSISANVFTEDAAGNEGEGQSASFDYTVDGLTEADLGTNEIAVIDSSDNEKAPPAIAVQGDDVKISLDIEPVFLSRIDDITVDFSSVGGGVVSATGSEDGSFTASVEITDAEIFDLNNFSFPITIEETNGNSSSISSQTVAIDTSVTAGYISLGVPSDGHTTEDTLVFNVVFTQDVSVISANDFELSLESGSLADLDITIDSVEPVSEDDASSYTVTVSGADLADLTDRLTLSVKDSHVFADTSGSDVIMSGTSATYYVDNFAEESVVRWMILVLILQITCPIPGLSM